MKNLEGKPFALIGVNVIGHEPKKLKEVMEKEHITWRSISSQAVTSRWNAGTPTYYVIDAKGVIRYKWVGSPGEKAIDMALEKLIREEEVDAKKVRRREKMKGGEKSFEVRSRPTETIQSQRRMDEQEVGRASRLPDIMDQRPLEMSGKRLARPTN